MNIDEKTIQRALRLYENQKEIQLRYREKNREKINNTAKSYYWKMKQDPEKYKMYLERCNKKYEKIKQDPEKHKEYLEKAKTRYYSKKDESNETPNEPTN